MHAFFFVGNDGNASGFRGLDAEERIFNGDRTLGFYAEFFQGVAINCRIRFAAFKLFAAHDKIKVLNDVALGQDVLDMDKVRGGGDRQFNAVLFGKINDFMNVAAKNGKVVHGGKKLFEKIKIALFDFF